MNKILMILFPTMKSTYVADLLKKKGINAKTSLTSELLFIKRPFTEEEKKEYDDKFLLGYSGIAAAHGGELFKTVVNPNYKTDVKEEYNKEFSNFEGVVTSMFKSILLEEAIPYFDYVYFIIPDEQTKYEIIGKELCDGNKEYAIQLADKDRGFDFLIKEMNEMVNKVILSTHEGKPLVCKVTLTHDYTINNFIDKFQPPHLTPTDKLFIELELGIFDE